MLGARAAPKTEADRQRHVSIDQRYDSYVALHANLDNLIWNNQATLHGVTVLGAGALGFVVEKFHPQVGDLSRPGALSLILLLMSGLYGITVFTLFRMRRWHRELEQALSRLEPEGYFHARASGARVLSAQLWTAGLYAALAGLCLVVGVRFAILALWGF